MSKNFVRRLGFEQFEGRIMLAAGGDDWNDNCQATPNIDFNWDGKGTALDALMLINDINWNGVYHLQFLSGDRSQLVDPDGDGYRGPGDVLVVINFINSGRGPDLMVCNEVVYQQYVDLGQIVVTPGQKDALVASVVFTAQSNSLNPVFLSQVTAVGDVDFMKLKDVEGNWIGMTWFEYQTMGVGDLQLNPGSSVQLNLFADIPENASGVLEFGLKNPYFRTFPGETVQTSVLNGNNSVVVEQPYPKPTIVETQGFGPGLSVLGSIGWGSELDGGDFFDIQISVAGPNLHGDLPVFLPIQSMTVKSKDGKFTDDVPVGWWSGDTLVESFTFSVPHKTGDIDYLFGQVEFRQELLDAVFWLTVFDQDGILAVSDKAPVCVL